MLIIQRESTDPYFNIATEEFLIKTLEEPCFMLWQNTPSVIMGKHQNPLKEVNLDYLNQHQIPVIRRISGGGTVYHDLGNLNYSFIDMGKAESLVNFAKYSRPVLDLLQSLNVNAQLVGKSDLKIDGRKFSGNASHVYRNKVLHHGTLLFNSDLEVLNESIKINKNNITDKAVNSNRSVVGNISEHLHSPMNVEEFKSKLKQHIQNIFPESKLITLNNDQVSEIQELAIEKYKTWEWNFGYGPKYEINSNCEIQGKKIDFKFKIAKGFIKSFECSSPITADWQHALNSILDFQHEEQIINQKLDSQIPEIIKSSILRILF